ERPPPFLVPPQSAHTIVGRTDDVSRIKRRLLEYTTKPTVTTIIGLPGVGKTTLALEVAADAEIRSHFTGGVLWAGLGEVSDATAHLAAWAKALGLPTASMEKLTSLEDWAVAIRSFIGVRRILLVIDDAWSERAALALFVGGPHCATLITTRFPSVATALSA